jgi:hypothetical protein
MIVSQNEINSILPSDNTAIKTTDIPETSSNVVNSIVDKVKIEEDTSPKSTLMREDFQKRFLKSSLEDSKGNENISPTSISISEATTTIDKTDRLINRKLFDPITSYDDDDDDDDFFFTIGKNYKMKLATIVSPIE